jgi:hypothetical protein
MSAASTDKNKGTKYPGRHPIDVSDTAWFYEERGRINVIAELKQTTTGEATVHLGTTHTKIPMRLLCRVVDRYRRAKRK